MVTICWYFAFVDQHFTTPVLTNVAITFNCATETACTLVAGDIAEILLSVCVAKIKLSTNAVLTTMNVAALNALII